MNKSQISSSKQNTTVVFLVFFIPTILLLIGFFAFPYPGSRISQQSIFLPLFLGLILLGTGFLWKHKNQGSKIKIVGWSVFAFYWATRPSFLYYSEAGDVFNAAVCIIGVYVLLYLAYHEWVSIQKNDHLSCLNWIAGSSFLAGIIYFTLEADIIPGVKNWLIETVATHSADVLRLVGLRVRQSGSVIVYNEIPINIIFACTAIQAAVLFVGMNGALHTISLKRKVLMIAMTLIPVYFLNLVRNASVIFLVGGNITSFNIAHNVLSKAGALLVLIVLLFVNFRVVPELYTEITGIIDLPKHEGPVEVLFRKLLRKK